MTALDWPALMRLGLRQLRLHPRDFWALTPAELLLMAGLEAGAGPLTPRPAERSGRALPPTRRKERPMTTLTDFEAQIAALEARLDQAGGLVAQFDSELGTLGRTMTFTGREVDGLSRNFAGGLRRAFDGVIFDGMRLQDALRGIAQTMIDSVYNAAMKPVQNAFGGVACAGRQWRDVVHPALCAGRCDQSGDRLSHARRHHRADGRSGARGHSAVATRGPMGSLACARGAAGGRST